MNIRDKYLMIGKAKSFSAIQQYKWHAVEHSNIYNCAGNQTAWVCQNLFFIWNKRTRLNALEREEGIVIGVRSQLSVMSSHSMEVEAIDMIIYAISSLDTWLNSSWPDISCLMLSL